MNSWATRRRAIILGALVLVLSAITFAVFWKYWYAAPTCFDKTKNGDEVGIDCGGSCALICSGGAVKPVVRWDPRLFEVIPGTWSALIYLENPNTDAEAAYLPYTLTVYDEKNNVLEKREKATILPRNKTIGVFEGSILVKDGVKPRRAIFEIGNNIVWQKSGAVENNLSITNGPLLKLESAPRVEAEVKNNGTTEIKNIELVAAIFDGSDNAIAASRTFVDKLKKGENANVFFTWPRPFDLGSKVCEKPSSVMLLLDRSGSMTSFGLNPPQPLTGAKEAADSFVKQLNQNDKVGVVSFAVNSKNPIDAALTADFESVKKIIDSVAIEKNSIQYTNIYEPLHSAWQELISARATEESSKIIILLTDGVANNPTNPQGKTEADDIKYAEDLALKEATNIKKEGLIIYTIGLGNEINESFLKSIASKTDYYFFAPTADDLQTIYKNISSDICQEKPARIEITYKIFGDLK